MAERTASETLTAAAQELSARRAALRSVVAEESGEWTDLVLGRIRGLQSDVVDAELAYSAAYKAYTDPFGLGDGRYL